MQKLVVAVLVCVQFAAAQSVYELSAKDYTLASGALFISAAGMYVESRLLPFTPEQVENLQPHMNRLDLLATKNYSNSAAHWSDMLGMACMLAPFTLFTDERVRDDFSTNAMIYAETMLLNGGAVYLCKSLVKRPRPYVYNPQVPVGLKLQKDARMAFFSGHTSMSFASAVLFAKAFGDYFPNSSWKETVWAGSLLTAGTVGILRIAAGQHYPTDVLVGALVGGAIGYFVPELHKISKQSTEVMPPLQVVSLRFTF